MSQSPLCVVAVAWQELLSETTRTPRSFRGFLRLQQPCKNGKRLQTTSRNRQITDSCFGAIPVLSRLLGGNFVPPPEKTDFPRVIFRILKPQQTIRTNQANKKEQRKQFKRRDKSLPSVHCRSCGSCGCGF